MGFVKGSTRPTIFPIVVILTRQANHVFRLSETAKFVQSLMKKYFQNICCTVGQITSINHPILTRQEGRFANVSNVGQVAVDVGGFIDD